jgi:hypothetical protein
VLKFGEEELQCNSTILGLFSSVLRGAVEAHTAGGKNNSSKPASTPNSKLQIPVEGVTKEEWLTIAAFWYPVKKAAVVADWDQAQLLLRVGSMFDLAPVLQKADAFITANAISLLKDPESPKSIWKWFILADKCCLQDSLPVLAKRAVLLGRAACSNADNLQALSAAGLRELVAVLSASKILLKCQGSSCCASDESEHNVSMTVNCANCRRQNVSL